MNPKDIKFAKITKLSVFRELSTKFATRIDQINSIRIKNQELVDREVNSFRESIENKNHLFNRPLSNSDEITEMLELMGHDTYIRLQFPNLVRQTLLTSIFSSLETFSRQLISLTEEHSEAKIKFDDLSNSGGELEQIRRYFSLVHEVDYESVNKEWSTIQDLRNLRNFITHYSGNITAFEEDKGTKRKKTLESLVNRRKMEIREGNLFISHDNEFALQCMRASKSYFSHIAKSLEAVTNKPTVEVTWEFQDDGTTKEIRKEV